MDFLIYDFIILKMGSVFLDRKHLGSGQEVSCLTEYFRFGIFCLFAYESNLRSV